MVEQVKTKMEPYVRFRGFTDEWEEVKLGDVLEKEIKGKAQKSKLVDGDVEYLDADRLNGGGPFLSDNAIDVSYEDILVLWDGSKAGTVYTGFEGALGSTLKAYTVDDENHSGFVYQWLSLNQDMIYERYRTPNIPHVIKDFTTAFSIYRPSLDEQQKIGDLFQTLDKTIDLSNTQVVNLKQQKKALLQRLFPQKGETEPKVRLRGFTDEWNEVKLGDVAKLKNGYSFKSDLYTDNGSYKILTIGNITGDTYIDTTSTKTISKLPENIQGHQILSVGDILISMTGNVGRVSMVDVEDTLLNQRVGLIDVGDTVDRTFMYQVLSTPLFEANMVNRGQGAAQMNIGKSDIESYRIYTPSLEEQQAVGELFQTVDEQIRLAEDKVSQYKELKQALLQRLFV